MSLNRRSVLTRLAASSVLAAIFARHAAAETTSYAYDARGRLIKVTFADGQIVEYTYDAAGNRTQVARVSGAPSIASFAASPSTINGGSSSTLSWSVTNATSVSINQGVGTVTGSSCTVSPLVTTTYTLTATGPAGQTTAQTTVTVNPTTFTQTIQVTGTGPVNLRTLANNAGYNGFQPATITFEVANGVTITGTGGAAGSGAGGVAIDSGTWPTGSYTIALTLVVKNGGKVRGGGGGGGVGSGTGSYLNGGSGGDAIYCRLPMTITFQTGSEVKSGGYGGSGGTLWDPNPFDEIEPSGEGGGGGGGAPNGEGGPGAGYGAGGDPTGGGAGGAGYGDGSAGSAGGNYAEGGAYCVRKNGHSVTVTNNGTTAGTIG